MLGGNIGDIVAWLTVGDVSRQTGYSVPTVYRDVHAGKLTAVKTRLGWLIDPDALASYRKQPRGRPRRNVAA